MDFLIADTFTDALARLPAQEQKAVKMSAFDLQLDPSSPGLSFHRIDRSKDPNFWSVRVNLDIRIVVHKTEASLLLAYVDHHDRAYAWAERRRIETHPRTGAVQIVEVRERVEEISHALPAVEEPASPPTSTPLIFAGLTTDDLLSVGIPEDWIADARTATEDSFFALAPHLPAEAAEALLEFAATGILKKPTATQPADPFIHPDAQRRFRFVENQAELAAALDAPWDKWAVFLHPSQRTMVERSFSGPARVAGSAGTGKTVVALHRAARLAAGETDSRLLLTTFSRPLAASLERKLRVLAGPESGVVPRITVAPLREVASELFQLALGRKPHVVADDALRALLVRAAGTTASPAFVLSEWQHVVDAWQIDSLEAYAGVPRLGRRNRLGARQRERLWPVFEKVRASLSERGLTTWPAILAKVAGHHTAQTEKPFSHIIVDEAQDLGVPELRFLAAVAPSGGDALFFAGDSGQRIFQQPFSWRSLGIDVRGRSLTLSVNYRTSHQIRTAADRLLPTTVRDVDGVEEERRGTVSVFEGPIPAIELADGEEQEVARVATFIREAIAAGIVMSEIGVFVRSPAEMPRARRLIAAGDLRAYELSEQGEDAAGRLALGTMHQAKGLEFKAVVVMACDDEVLPLASRIQGVADEVELEDVYETERHLLYVACTRARDRLLVTGVQPGSEFLKDLATSRS
ncbi:3'-5' exonuclease [uncultured Enterovirga sp.]|uniref:3'-5' exonuclease n=1 Tax=uncultured Enterovirga sp. TaxID=2026352 RepID=UPI0035CBBC99